MKEAVLHAIALAHYAIVYARAWATDSIKARVQLAAENDRLHEDCVLLREELRIKYIRMTQLAPQRRPHYSVHKRMAILELRAARGWSVKQTADTFLITPATVGSWMKRINEIGPDALLQLREPVNKFPDFARYIVQRLKTLSSSMGKAKIAETLCRAGLHLGTTTVGRILKEDPGRVEDWCGNPPGEPLACIRSFLLRARAGFTVIPFPVPASSHAASGFPALRAPAHFTSKFMGPHELGALSASLVDGTSVANSTCMKLQWYPQTVGT